MTSTSSLSIALPTVMQLEKLWFDAFTAAAHAQRSDERSAAVRDSSRRMLRAVKRRVTPQFAHSQPTAQQTVVDDAVADADVALRVQVVEAERAVQELSEAVAKQRASVLLVVRERAEKKMRLLYDAPVARLTAGTQPINVSNSDLNLASEPLCANVAESCAQLAHVLGDCTTNAASTERKLSQLTTVLQHHMEPNAVEELLRAGESDNARKRKRAK